MCRVLVRASLTGAHRIELIHRFQVLRRRRQNLGPLLGRRLIVGCLGRVEKTLRAVSQPVCRLLDLGVGDLVGLHDVDEARQGLDRRGLVLIVEA